MTVGPRSFVRDEEGQDLVEYAILFSFVAFGFVLLFGGGVIVLWDKITVMLAALAALVSGG
ncbi:MAG: hypothetical protein M3R06_03530 [Chloroflexota bacterium]|nr:hypothetical protein [Chloroflexota bacterium]